MNAVIRPARRPELPVLQEVERAAATLFPAERLPDPEQARSLAKLERRLALELLWALGQDDDVAGLLTAQPLNGALQRLGFRILCAESLPQPLAGVLARERAAGLSRRVAMSLTVAGAR